MYSIFYSSTSKIGTQRDKNFLDNMSGGVIERDERMFEVFWLLVNY